MKCKSVACIWSSSPPVHKVTASAVLRRPPTLYTGGSDGSIIWWKLPSSNENDDDTSSGIRAIAMLCGHTAPIADLGICSPMAEGKADDMDDVESNFNSIRHGALVSACTDGVLCVWSRTSGNCRRRRKMPPWVGSPSMIRPLPENQRYVCVACCFIDHVSSSDHHSVDTSGDGHALVDGEFQYGKPSKCSVVVVDSYTLTIIHTVFHGNLLGPLKCIALVFATEATEKRSVAIVDAWGNLQYVPILQDSEGNRENVAAVEHNSPTMEMMKSLNDLKERGPLMSFANRGQVLALIYRTCCIFKLVDGTAVGEISFLDVQLCLEGKSHIIDGMFLDDNDSIAGPCTEKPDNEFEEEFAVWNNWGSALLYRISYSSNFFNFQLLCAVPASSNPLNVKSSSRFIQFDRSLIRIESICFHTEEPSLWKPHISMWLLTMQIDTDGKVCLECKGLGESQFFDDWNPKCNFNANQGLNRGAEITETDRNDSVTSQSCAPDPKDQVVTNVDHGFEQKQEFVSSSMVVSDNYYIPSAIIYGFYSGDIEIVRFNMDDEEADYHGISKRHNVDLCTDKQHLSGHTGAVLCLAAHRIMNSSRRSSFSHILVSGSMDCTVRLWDLDSGAPILVMHQHVAPVRQIILPPLHTGHPWKNCFLSVGEDSCVSLTSFDTLRVERMFPGHPYYPSRVVWDSARGYIACLCPNQSGKSDGFDVLYIWDVKTAVRERVLRGSAAHSMFDHFFLGTNQNIPSGSLMNRNTSASSLFHPIPEETKFPQPQLKFSKKGNSSPNISSAGGAGDFNAIQPHAPAAVSALSKLSVSLTKKKVIINSSPFPGIAALCFDLSSLMSLCKKHEFSQDGNDKQKESNSIQVAVVDASKSASNHKENVHVNEQGADFPSSHPGDKEGTLNEMSAHHHKNNDSELALEGYLLQFSLSFLHLWNVDDELDELLVNEMKLKRPDSLKVACGLLGDRGALTLAFPSLSANLELWRSSLEYCAMRSLTMVSLAQHMISLSHSCSAANSALAAFYTRNFAEKIADIAPPLLQLLVSFWQDEAEHVKMAARSLFHCAASRAIPLPLCRSKGNNQEIFVGYSCERPEGQSESLMPTAMAENKLGSDVKPEGEYYSQEESEIISWLESFEMQDWISCVGGTSQDAMTSHIIVASALAVWYPSLVKPTLAKLVVHPLVRLVMAMNEKYSCTAAEILAEGMENTWKECIGSEIPRLLGDIFFQIECVSSASTSLNIRDTLVGVLLPSLAMADTPVFLNVIESQIWSTASDSPVHVVSLMTLIRVIRGSPRNLVQYLDKVIAFVLQTMDPGNSVMRKTCLQSSMTALREVVRVFPMVALNDTSTRLAVGDAISEIRNATIRIYDMQSMAIVKVLDASGPPGLPTLLGGASETAITTAISALTFSPDGEGLIAFSENGLMIRWWSLGSVWWEKLSRNLSPVQCTKLIFVPPWEGFSPNSTRSSIMASVTSSIRDVNSQEKRKDLGDIERLKHLIQNLELSYRLEWVDQRKVKLIQHGHELGIFQI